MKSGDFSGLFNPDYPGVAAICDKTGNEAVKAAASFFRKHLESTEKRLFSIPYEKPENVYKLPSESDEEACRRLCGGTVVSVGVPSAFGSPDKVDWHSNPTYNGYREWTWQLSRHNGIKMLAHQYILTGDKSLSKAAEALLSSWLRTCPPPAIGVSGGDTDCWRTIECGIRMGANWPYIIYAFYRDFSDELLADILISLHQHGVRLHHDYMYGNWRLMEMNGLMHIAVLFPFFRESEEWKSFAISMMEDESCKQIYPDGMQYELTTGYHEVAVNNYQRMLSVMQAFGITLPSSLLSVMENATNADIKLMMPSGRLPDINDGTPHVVKELLIPKSRLVSNDAIRWIISDGKDGRKPEYDSIAMEYAGFFIFRSGWADNDIYAHFDSAPFGRMHQHEDKLSLIIADGSKTLIADAGCYAYDDSPVRRYVLSSYGHNVLLVDGMGQNRKKGYEWHDEDIKKKSDLRWHIGKDTEWASGEYSGPYGDECVSPCKWKRTVMFVKKSSIAERPFFIVSDCIESDEEHEYTLLWHVDSKREAIYSSSALYSDISVSFDGEGELSAVRGQMNPVQGIIATGKEQGLYKAVDTLEYRKTASSCRFVTVIAFDGSPFSVSYDGGSVRLERDGKSESYTLEAEDEK